MAGPYLSPLGPQADLLTEYMFGRRRQVSVCFFLLVRGFDSFYHLTSGIAKLPNCFLEFCKRFKFMRRVRFESFFCECSVYSYLEIRLAAFTTFGNVFVLFTFPLFLGCAVSIIFFASLICRAFASVVFVDRWRDFVW